MTRNFRRAVVTALAGAALSTPVPAHAAGTYADGVLADAPLTYHRLGEASGATVAQDASGHGRHGVYAGAPGLGVAGPFTDAGTAVRLGAADTITATVAPASGSVELWVAPERLARGQQAGIAAHGEPAGSGWALGIGDKRKLTWVTGGVAVTSRLSLAAGVWTQLTLTWTDKKLDIYRNGALAKSINRNGAAPAGGALVLGGTGAGAFTGAFAGRLDEVSLYAVPLNAVDVQEHFAAARVPINTALPTVTGTAVVGATLTAHPGTWSDGGVAKYQWQRCDASGEDCGDLVGATGTQYAVAAADACGTLQVAVTMTSASGEGTAISDATATVPGSCAPPTSDPGTTVGAGPIPPTGGGDPAGSSDPPAGGDPPAGATLPTSGSCLKLAAGRRRAKLRGVGALRLRAATGACLSAPLRASFTARRGVRVRSVRYLLDGKRLKAGRRAARLQVAALTAGTHTLTVRVRPEQGRVQRAKLRLQVAAG